MGPHGGARTEEDGEEMKRSEKEVVREVKGREKRRGK